MFKDGLKHQRRSHWGTMMKMRVRPAQAFGWCRCFGYGPKIYGQTNMDVQSQFCTGNIVYVFFFMFNLSAFVYHIVTVVYSSGWFLGVPLKPISPWLPSQVHGTISLRWSTPACLQLVVRVHALHLETSKTPKCQLVLVIFLARQS